MTQLKDIYANASHLLHAAQNLEGVMKRIERRPANASLRHELDDAMAEVVSAQKRCQRLAVLINELRAFQPDDNGPSGTACDVASFAKAGGPRPRPRAVPAPIGDEFDEPRARRQPVGGFDPI